MTKTEKKGYQFGTFQGVYVPSILTILGIIMYLRFGWVLGNAGLGGTLAIVCIANMITFLTGLSISTLATNMKVEGGGSYYMISRSLGLNAGAAVGLPLFLAQALSISFYTIGFAESIHSLAPAVSIQMTAIVTLLVLTAFAYFSADLALKVQLLIFLLIAASLASFFLGGPVTGQLPQAATSSSLPDIQSFWILFAVFFPAVTGIEAGISLSGDLKNPSRSIPMGTLAAVLTGWIIYLAIPVCLSSWVPDPRMLMDERLIMKNVSRWGSLILAGVWGASLSSALSSLLSAPRTLQALARDRVVFSFLGKGFGPNGDPRFATAVSFGIGMMGILAGNLNTIATVLSMFFLTAYGLLNMSAFLESLIAPPSWRPKFKVHWTLSFLGAAACLWAMFMINIWATIAATLISAIIYLLIQKRKLTAYWGDIVRGAFMMGARIALYWLSSHPPNSHSWKPNILVLSGSPTTRWYLIALADAVSHGKGFLTVATILPESVAEADKVGQIEKSIHAYLKQRHVPAFVKVYTENDVMAGARSLIKSYGFGPMFPNTVLLGESEKEENIEDYVKLLLLIHGSERNLIVVRESDSAPPPAGSPRIDVWWNLKSPNLGLMLAFAYLLKTSPEWIKSELVLKTIVATPQEAELERQQLEAFIEENRLLARAEVFVSGSDEIFYEIRRSSEDAGLVFLGIRPPEKKEDTAKFAAYYEDLLEKTDGFPPIAFILAAEEINFDRLFEFSPPGNYYQTIGRSVKLPE